MSVARVPTYSDGRGIHILGYPFPGRSAGFRWADTFADSFKVSFEFQRHANESGAGDSDVRHVVDAVVKDDRGSFEGGSVALGEGVSGVALG